MVSNGTYYQRLLAKKNIYPIFAPSCVESCHSEHEFRRPRDWMSLLTLEALLERFQGYQLVISSNLEALQYLLSVNETAIEYFLLEIFFY